MGPGDLIEVSVFEVEELSKLKLRIPIRGTITFPLIGQIPAAGRTAAEFEDDIRARLEQKYMHDPQVSVFVHEQKSQRISIIGAVRRGGVYTITSPLRLADALALAEGLTDDADHTIYLIRRVPAGTAVQIEEGVAPPRPQPALPENKTEQVMVPIDLELLAGGRDELNVALQAGDVVHVPRAGSYYVGGSVERPGSFFLKGKTTADQAIMAAGGPRAVADWEDVRVYRMKPGGEREILTFNLSEFEKGNGHTAPELQKNDVIIVGKSSAKAFLFGTLDFIRGMFSISRGL
jgi:polysaccharide export outer membrane protein